mmetsp:Transcript_32826/g.71573  ORF Transcript_32826/g.71573 Transcript_32826/m.71573 type:complete len:212 (-) Transcript_32826:320-955(-)
MLFLFSVTFDFNSSLSFDLLMKSPLGLCSCSCSTFWASLDWSLNRLVLRWRLELRVEDLRLRLLTVCEGSTPSSRLDTEGVRLIEVDSAGRLMRIFLIRSIFCSFSFFSSASAFSLSCFSRSFFLNSKYILFPLFGASSLISPRLPNSSGTILSWDRYEVTIALLGLEVDVPFTPLGLGECSRLAWDCVSLGLDEGAPCFRRGCLPPWRAC